MIEDREVNNRPILVQALTETTLCEVGKLYANPNILIKYDPTYTVPVGESSDGTTRTTRGKISWMKDTNNNESNFDFLDYYDFEGNPLTTLYDFSDGIHKSIFPTISFNNNVTLHDLKGTVLTDGLIDDSATYKFEV